MTSTTPGVRVALRIPGEWSDPGQLFEGLPEGCRLTPEALFLPDGSEVEFIPMPPDDEFAQIFTSSCRQPPKEHERQTVNRYRVNVGLAGPGGSLEAARTMMRAGAAIVQAGGAGVFIDNSGVAHGGTFWQQMTEDGSPDALSYAFVGIIGSEREVWTVGLHVLGFPDIVINRADCDEDGETLIEIIRYICSSEKPVEDGHIIVDETGPRFQAATAPGDPRFVGGPMENPYGRLRLSSFREIAEGN
jgi:hypothetical protein